MGTRCEGVTLWGGRHIQSVPLDWSRVINRWYARACSSTKQLRLYFKAFCHPPVGTAVKRGAMTDAGTTRLFLRPLCSDIGWSSIPTDMYVPCNEYYICVHIYQGVVCVSSLGLPGVPFLLLIARKRYHDLGRINHGLI